MVERKNCWTRKQVTKTARVQYSMWCVWEISVRWRTLILVRNAKGVEGELFQDEVKRSLGGKQIRCVQKSGTILKKEYFVLLLSTASHQGWSGEIDCTIRNQVYKRSLVLVKVALGRQLRTCLTPEKGRLWTQTDTRAVLDGGEVTSDILLRYKHNFVRFITPTCEKKWEFDKTLKAQATPAGKLWTWQHPINPLASDTLYYIVAVPFMQAAIAYYFLAAYTPISVSLTLVDEGIASAAKVFSNP